MQDLSLPLAKIKIQWQISPKYSTGDVVQIHRTAGRSGDRVTPFPRRKQNSYGVFKLVTMAGTIFICFLFAVIVIQLFQHSRLQKELESAESRVGVFETRNEEIAEEIDRLQEPGYIEVLARKLLGLVRPGEVVFQLED